MPLLDYVAYKAGYVPHQDTVAQERCYQYLQQTLAELKRKDEARPSQTTKNLISMYTSIRNLAENTEGSINFSRAQSFWNNWDRTKVQIIQLRENTDDDIDVQKVLEKLEDGRYIPS